MLLSCGWLLLTSLTFPLVFLELNCPKLPAGVWPLDSRILVTWDTNCCMANPDLIKLATELPELFRHLMTTDFSRGKPQWNICALLFLWLYAPPLKIRGFSRLLFSFPSSEQTVVLVIPELLLHDHRMFPVINLQSPCISCYLQADWVTAGAMGKPARAWDPAVTEHLQIQGCAGTGADIEYHPHMTLG